MAEQEKSTRRKTASAEARTEEPRTQAAGADETESEETDAQDDPELDALAALAQMDLEAALAYEAAAAIVENEDLRNAINQFAEDHQRHVRDLSELIEQRRGETASQPEEALNSVFTNLVSALAMMGDQEALRGLLGNEQFTNMTYMTAMDVVSDDQALKVIERNFQDEQRHLKFLLDMQKRTVEEAEESSREESQMHA